MKNQREIAFEILSQNKYSNIELQKLSHHPHRAFITHLVYTVYQNYELLVFQTADFLKKPVIKEIEVILAMAAAQHYFMDSVVEYALVIEAVELAKKVNVKFGGLVNAVLKKMVQRPMQLSKSSDELIDLSINTSHPLWIVKLCKAQYGLDVTKRLLEHHNTEAPIDVRINTTKTSVEEMIEKYPVSFEGDYLTASSEIFKTDALEKGLLLVQDRNSQRLINDIKDINGINILDACTAPGTKLTQLASRNKDYQLVGVDLYQHRIDLTKRLVDRWGLDNIDLVVSDILEYHRFDPFDLILCDVPCSGLGVLRRKPDIKRRIQPEDLDELEILQQAILVHTASLLREGGLLVYATCTLNKKENEKQIETFLMNHSDFELIHQETLIGVDNNGDSFYSAHLVKKSGIIS